MDSGKKSGGGRVVFTFYSLCQSLWGSSPTVNNIPNSIDSQDDSSEALTSAASHFSSTVTDEIGLFDDHQKTQQNVDSTDDAADDEEVSSNPVGQSQQYPGRKKWKPSLNIVEVKISPHAWVPSPKCFKRKLLEQLEKSDAVLTKISPRLDALWILLAT